MAGMAMLEVLYSGFHSGVELHFVSRFQRFDRTGHTPRPAA